MEQTIHVIKQKCYTTCLFSPIEFKHIMSSEIKRRSGAWYLLPIFLSIIGGVIAYFVIKEDDPKKAKNCLYLGIALTAIPIAITIIMAVVGIAANPMMGA